MQGHDLLDLITKHLDANRMLFIHGNYLDRVTAHPEGATLKGHIVALVLHIDEASEQLVALY